MGSPRRKAGEAVELDPLATDPRYTIEALRNDREFWRANCLKVLTKEHGLQPFVLNTTQRIILAEIKRIRDAGVAPRIIILKSRQVGCSTVIQSELFSDCFLNPHRQALVVADNDDNAHGLFRMSARFNRYLPKHLRMKERLNNVSEIEFPNESRLQVDTQGDIHSMTAQRVHLSEFGYYLKAEHTLNEALQAVPNEPSTLVAIESTANGVGNELYEMFASAMTRKLEGRSVWEQGWFPIFVPWYQHEEYMMRPWFMPDQTTQEERALAKAYKLNMRQLAWRRWCLEANCRGDLEVFRVRYPSTWEEAFLLSGRPIFPHDQLERYARMQPPIDQEALWLKAAPSEIEMDVPTQRPIVVEADKGRLRIFRMPNPRHTYILGADPSEGDRKSDASPIEVFDQMTLEFVAEWWGRTPPDVLGKYAALLGLLYNEAVVNAEANNHGIAFFKTLEEMAYPNVWFRTTHEESVAGETTLKPGLWETNKTKHTMFTLFRRYVREGRGGIYSPILLGEMRTAVYERKEGMNATKITKPAGKLIDTAVSAAICLYTHAGGEAEPILPLPERELLTAQTQYFLARERDPLAAEQVAVDLTGMTGAELEAVLEARYQRKVRAGRLGFGTAR